MLTLKAEKRNPDEKAKKLRRDGFITGVLYGKEMKENVSLKFTEKDASAFIKNAKEGTQAYLELDGKNVDVLVKNIDFDPLTKKYMALDFQALVAGEIVSATVPIVYVNEDKVQGIFEAELSEVHYKADPAHLLEPVEIDLATLPQTTKTMYVKDLKLEEKGVHVTTSGTAAVPYRRVWTGRDGRDRGDRGNQIKRHASFIHVPHKNQNRNCSL
ncbi:MAG: 50S ribosomal protein L25 [Waltera sp.]